MSDKNCSDSGCDCCPCRHILLLSKIEGLWLNERELVSEQQADCDCQTIDEDIACCFPKANVEGLPAVDAFYL